MPSLTLISKARMVLPSLSTNERRYPTFEEEFTERSAPKLISPVITLRSLTGNVITASLPRVRYLSESPASETPPEKSTPMPFSKSWINESTAGFVAVSKFFLIFSQTMLSTVREALEVKLIITSPTAYFFASWQRRSQLA